MPEILDWCEQEFPSDRRSTRHAARRPGDRVGRSQVSPRPIIPSSQPILGVLDHAKRYRRDGPARLDLKPDLKMLRHLAFCCQERSDLLDKTSDHAEALIAFSAHWRDWLRPPDAWEPPDEDANGQFRSLARHLFARYDVPRCLDAAWLAGLTAEGLRYQGWYKLVGRGENIRTAADLPILLTRTMSHWFAKAPDDLDIPSAFRWAQVRGMGGDDRLARTILDGRIGIDFDRDEFWITVIRWLITHNDLAPRLQGAIIDYVYDQKFVPSVANPLSRQAGQARQPLAIPPQPNLSMKGRTAASMLKAVEDWHRRLRIPVQGASFEWPSSGIAPLSCEVGTGPSRLVYSTTELISSAELHEEGAAMHHCVVSYLMRCFSGQRSIWSLTVEDASGGSKRLLTLEVRSKDRLIVQAKGCNNREPDNHERFIIARWSESGGPLPVRDLLVEEEEE
jgi:hypothetical protein